MNKFPEGPAPLSSPQVPRVAYSIPEAAASLGIGRTLLYKLIGERQIKSQKIGKRHVITAKELEDFLRRNQGGE
jgi:excisionase family DNA binding protein